MTDALSGGSGAWDEQFDVILSRLTEVYGLLDALSAQQEALIEHDDVDRLLAVLSERENLIVDLESMMPEFDAQRRQWDTHAPELAEIKRTTFSRRIDALEKMAQVIAQRDARAAELLDLKRDSIAQSLAELGRGNSAVHAYQNGDLPDGTPRFQDRKG